MSGGNRHVILAAGGTGGHMIPAHALGVELTRRGYDVSLVTDERGLGYPGLFPNVPKHTIASGSPSRGGIGGLVSSLHQIWQGRAAALRLYETFGPAAVVGFGGYPAFPALWAAFSAKLPTLIHEQNAVLGRANRLLARKVDAIALSFPETRRLSPAHAAKALVTGNPVRADILALRDEAYPEFSEDSVFRVVVIGGSQGASILSDVVPEALRVLPTILKVRLQVTQQCRPEDLEKVRAAYAEEGIAAELGPYIEDMADCLRYAHLVIARAGASTLAELTAVGRPAILVPLPGATDDHQTLNAAEMVAAGGARVIRQSQFTPAELAKQIQKIALEPQGLPNAAARARSVGKPDAVAKLADMVERLAGSPAAATMGNRAARMMKGALA
jgi:UDP-N-acetylglucosamine--N-acetylmuramyl-(pentapeptide) pyrophosphoryl-undecaprenol N-acetylglucosamine transferase